MVVPVATATAADQEVIRALLDAAGLPTEDLAADLLSFFVVAKIDGAVIATGAIERGERLGLLRSVAVLPRFRSQGVGQRIVEALERRAHLDRLSALYLLTTSRADFFSRLGYRALVRANAPPSIRATAQFRALCPASSTLMVKEMGHCDEQP